MLFEAEAKDILIGACDVFMYPFTGTEIPEDAVIETAEHSVGHCSSGFTIDYKPTKYEVTNHHGSTVKSYVTKEEISAKTGIMSWDLERLTLLSTAEYTVEKEKKKKKLLALIAVITFFMSAVLDNLTTSIVMIMLIRKLLGNYKERWVFGSIIIIAANSGGAWSPIGDVTTIMLWVRGNISTSSTIPHLILPSIVSALIPVLIAMRFLHGNVTPPNAFSQMEADNELLKKLKDKEKLSILIIGVLCLLFVPVFKTVTHLPPFMGILMGVGILWFYTEMLYARKPIDEDLKLRLSKVVHRIDGATLLFFLGILLAVDALRCSGVLSDFAFWLDDTVGNVYAVNLIIGALSSIVDNVPLVAGAIGMYPVATDAMVAAATDPAYLANFMQDGVFWQFLAYCAGVGGSMLIIGSAAGVVVMGLERINFIWYLKNISLLALAGYLSGAVVYILQNLIL